MDHADHCCSWGAEGASKLRYGRIGWLMKSGASWLGGDGASTQLELLLSRFGERVFYCRVSVKIKRLSMKICLSGSHMP